MKSEMRVVVEVDGKPVGTLILDIGRLWPLIDHPHTGEIAAEWIDRKRFHAKARASAMQNLSNRLQAHLYKALGTEIVRAQLDVEGFALKAESAAQAFGRTRKDIGKLALQTGRKPTDIHAFFWRYMLDESESPDLKKDLKKNWKTPTKKRR